MSFNTPDRTNGTHFRVIDQHRRAAGVAWPAAVTKALDTIDASLRNRAELPDAKDIDIAEAVRNSKGDPLNDKAVQRLLFARMAQDMHLPEWLTAAADRARVEVIRQHADELLAAFAAVIRDNAPALHRAVELDIDLKHPDVSSDRSSEWLLALVEARNAEMITKNASSGWLKVAEVAYRARATTMHLVRFPDYDSAMQYRLGRGVDVSPFGLARAGFKLEPAESIEELNERRAEFKRWDEQRLAEDAVRSRSNHSYPASKRPVMKIAPRR